MREGVDTKGAMPVLVVTWIRSLLLQTNPTNLLQMWVRILNAVETVGKSCTMSLAYFS